MHKRRSSSASFIASIYGGFWIMVCTAGMGDCDANFRTIGNQELIDKRSRLRVPVAPGGTLGDYVPFYFTPFSIMLLNIKTGFGGIRKLPNAEIAILVSSLHRVKELGIPFVFTDRHAYSFAAEYFNDLADLDRIDWTILQRRDFKHDPDDPGKKERYQAEALIWQHVPLEALLGVCCYNEVVRMEIQAAMDERGVAAQARVRADWYF